MIDDPSTDSLLLVMEHVDGGSLEQPYDASSKTWETLPESLVHRHFRELCKVFLPFFHCVLLGVFPCVSKSNMSRLVTRIWQSMLDANC